MRIPKSFNLLGRTINVEWEDRLLYADDLQGRAQYRFNRIGLQRPSQDQPLPNVEVTFCHELVHWLLYFAGSSYSGKTDHMHQDEAFTETVAGLLHQALDTMEYVAPEPDPSVVGWIEAGKERDRAVGALLLLAHEGVISMGRARELLDMDIYQQREEMGRLFGKGVGLS